jgi:hypothetical protein
MSTKHICCYSGGLSSALAAIEVKRRFGPENMALVNHDMHFSVEDPDIKRFKREVAEYCGVPITYVNHKNAQLDQFDVCVQAKAFKVGDGTELCTSRLKTQPFMKWLKDQGDCIVYYGFDPHEKARIQRRSSIMAAQGYRTDFPLATWTDRTIHSTEEIGIKRPNTYGVYKHGNCVGCLKAGWQHWYIVFCTRPDIWLKAKWAEDEIGYAIHHDESGPVYLDDMEPKFRAMQAAGVEATEQIHHQRFWAQAKKVVKIHEDRERAVACDECSL